jgi:hypothetical protein
MPDVQHAKPQCAQGCLGIQRAGMDPHESQRIGVGNRANPDLAKQASRAHAMGPNCLATSRAALALQASQPQAGVRSCSTSTPSIDEPHVNSSANSSVALCTKRLGNKSWEEFEPPALRKEEQKSTDVSPLS